jgi:signal transduction histidine kinase
MMKRLTQGGTITRQVAVIVLGSLFLAHVLSTVVWMRFAPPPPSIQILASRIDMIARMAIAVGPAGRAGVVAAAVKSGLSARLVDRLPPELENSTWRGAPRLREALTRDSRQPPLPVVFGPPLDEPHARASVAIALGDGSWIVFTTQPVGEPAVDLVWFAPLVDVLFGALPLALLSIWAARRVTGPLVRLANAAEQVGTLADPLPLPEAGTREIRMVARAFNGLIDQLRRFVVDRTRMLAAISHDLRTPLTRLRLRAESIPDVVAREKMLQDILRMDAMISSTLAFIREDALEEKIEPIDMAALLATVCDAYSDSGADVQYFGPLHLAGACRPQAMERALNNLIDNAVKFGGSAIVRLHESAVDGPASNITIDVEDEGPGIPPNLRSEVFKPFTRGDTARGMDGGGVGLGLAIARTIIQDHDGTIELHERIPHGLLVRVRLPGAMQHRRPRHAVASALAADD